MCEEVYYTNMTTVIEKFRDKYFSFGSTLGQQDEQCIDIL